MRRAAARRLALLFVLLVTGLAEARVAAVEAIGMTVSDLRRSVAFYTAVLDFEPLAEVEVAGEPYERLLGVFPVRLRMARLGLGDERIELTEYVTPRGRPAPLDAQSNDRWFQHVAIVVRDMDAAYRRVAAHGVTHVSPEPQRLPDWNAQAGGIRAFYFRDPDGHPLELIWFPSGKGDARWQRPTKRLFLGIDHTAIATADTDASLAFYRDRLGLRVVGESRNSGPEQERLNAVRGARLRITALRAPRGPGIELLEYLAPGTGRPYPRDARPNDLLHWQTRVSVTAPATLDALGRPVAVPDRSLGYARAVAVRDPDGHYLEVVTP
ncbi:MAG TPA: VOC family protein [Candidatus Limnocylindria bacterium]|nr:VOC family protein [Candidatus Limnocylindria bacterium]